MTVDCIVDAEVVPTLDRAAAERLDKRIRLLVGTINDSIAKLHDLVQEAKHGDAHVALGFPSWTAYLADVFTVEVRLERGARAELVGYLSGEGMSQHTIADVVGVGVGTVNRDLAASPVPNGTPECDRKVIGQDGKSYPASKPPPRPAPPVDIDDDAAADKLADEQIAADKQEPQPEANSDVIEDVAQYEKTLLAAFKQTFAPHRLKQLSATYRREFLTQMKATIKELAPTPEPAEQAQPPGDGYIDDLMAVFAQAFAQNRLEGFDSSERRKVIDTMKETIKKLEELERSNYGRRGRAISAAAA